MRQILVLGRSDAERLVADPEWAVISIHDPNKSTPELRVGWGAVLTLAFHDKEDPELARMTGFWQLFRAEQARAACSFVERQVKSSTGLLIHCESGLSRSPAMARAMAERFGWVINSDWPRGNQLVYALTKGEESVA